MSTRSLSRWSVAIVIVALLFPAAAAAYPLGPRADQPAPPATVEQKLLDQLAQAKEATFWVFLNGKADLSGAGRIADWTARGKHVTGRLKETARANQKSLLDYLRRHGVSHKAYWLGNVVQVTGTRQLVDTLARRADVRLIVADGAYELPKPAPGADLPGVETLEWNIERINADDVWNGFGIRGDGIVVATVDTGVQFDHPALVGKYRGNLGGGTFDHNYNWFDPSEVCGSPSLVPCDNAGHGTHVTGTMVGDDEAGNQVGVAPGARWIAAKGCEDFGCSYEALIASGEWILAPTDLYGLNPREELRPHVVNNSWGGGPGDPFYMAIVDAWVAAGIFPAFANGNSGPFCDSSGSPGDYPQSYAAGAFDVDDNIAEFSSRGPSAFEGEIKPNVAAPGVSVRSSVPGDGYDSWSGTSMASPHVAGSVALLWSGAPTIVGDIAATRALLDQGAVDVDDTSCGGTAADNNVWGEGRLDAYASVLAAPRGPTGTLAGTVTVAGSGDPGDPIEGARISIIGDFSRTTFSGPDGMYSVILPVGIYDVTASAFGYLPGSATGVEIAEAATTTQDFALEPAPAHAVSGIVRDGEGNALAGATVTILGTPIPPATTDGAGAYDFPSVPEGTYFVRVDAGRCLETKTQELVVDGDETLDFALARRADGFGYFCDLVTPSFLDGTDVLSLYGDDDAIDVALPFPFELYGRQYETAWVSTNGFVNFLGYDAWFGNGPIPSPDPPNAAVYGFWDDLFVDDEAAVLTALYGAAPDRQFVIEWRNVAFFGDFSRRVGFEVVLHEDGRILLQYRDIDADPREMGNSATLGLEDEAGTIAFQYSANEALVSNDLAILFDLPPSGVVTGVVTDALDGQAIAGATVEASQGGSPVRTATTDADGVYRLRLPVGDYDLLASAAPREPASATVSIADGATETRDFALLSARAAVSPGAFEFMLTPGQSRTAGLTLENTGLADLTFQLAERAVAVGTNGQVKELKAGVTSRKAPAGYAAQRVRPSVAGEPVAVFMDVLPWGFDALPQVLAANGIPYDVLDSASMGAVDLSDYSVVFISNDQPQEFYGRFNANLGWFESYVAGGGFLWVGAASNGWNGGDFTGATLPGGAVVGGPVFDEFNDVADPSHPTMQGVPDPFFGTYASHAVFANLPAGTGVIATSRLTGEPTLVEYPFGSGNVLAFGQPFDFGWAFGQDTGLILENGVPYAYTFTSDVPWLTLAPGSGTVIPGASATIDVTADATGLEPGVYRARAIVGTNDPRHRSIQVPVSLIVPAYRQAVNTGGDAYVDVAGDQWAADRQYVVGGWGYTNHSAGVISTRRGISGTVDDPLYRDQRTNPVQYRFDGLPAGVYQVELRFAELQNKRPNSRLFDVIVEGVLVLPAHDISDEVGTYAADDHTFFVEVSDGTLNIRFVTRRGFGTPVVNAIRVTERPDR